MMSEVVKLENVCSAYEVGNVRTLALQDIKLKILAGEFLGIKGASGSGKSSLLNVIGLLRKPDEGVVSINGTNCSSITPGQALEVRRQYISYVFQSFNLIPALTVYRNIELPLIYQGKPKRERAKLTEKAIESFDLNAREGHYPMQLSGGQQQRVAIARAIVSKPSIILADEPTGNLDSDNGSVVLDSLASLNREGTTILMVTHSMTDISYCSRVVEMNDGHLVEE